MQYSLSPIIGAGAFGRCWGGAGDSLLEALSEPESLAFCWRACSQKREASFPAGSPWAHLPPGIGARSAHTAAGPPAPFSNQHWLCELVSLSLDPASIPVFSGSPVPPIFLSCWGPSAAPLEVPRSLVRWVERGINKDQCGAKPGWWLLLAELGRQEGVPWSRGGSDWSEACVAQSGCCLCPLAFHATQWDPVSPSSLHRSLGAVRGWGARVGHL